MSELSQYDYDLPKDLIAQQPLKRRSDARLLVVRRSEGSIDHAYVRDLPDILQAGDALVVNDTRVVAARLVGSRTATGGRWEGLFLEVDANGLWRVMSKTRGKLQPGETVTLHGQSPQDDTSLLMLTKYEDGTWAARPDRRESWDKLLEQVGRVPLPPYIRGGEMLPSDRESYQTIFADQPGAVAAPTAGLHFTAELLKRLSSSGVSAFPITLHVGLGTFRPITAESLAQHPMHREWGHLSADTAASLNATRSQHGRIVAVGTTAVRVLETAADAQGQIQAWSGATELFIRPPYAFRAVDALITNFHLPRTTLLVLAHAFGGAELMRRAYEEAISERYRFYSYGDAMLIL